MKKKIFTTDGTPDVNPGIWNHVRVPSVVRLRQQKHFDKGKGKDCGSVFYRLCPLRLLPVGPSLFAQRSRLRLVHILILPGPHLG